MKNDEKCIFGIGDDKKTIIIGLHDAAWQYMQDSRTHTFDFTALGVPVQIIVFRGPDQQGCIDLLKTGPHTLDHGFEDPA